MTPRPDSAVDVVIPLFNKRASLRRAVGSVLRQQHDRWRLFIVDDGSTDDSLDTVRSQLRDPRVVVLRQENAGPGPARNRGLAEGDAPYVSFLDADDEWEPDFLMVCLDVLERHRECAAIATSVFWGPNLESRVPLHTSQGITTGPWRCPPDLPYRDFKSVVDFFHSSATVSRRAPVEQLGGFYERVRSTYGEDGYLWARLLVNEPVYRLVEPHMRFHTDFSELGYGRSEPHPIPPLLLEADELIRAAPASHREFVRGYLEWYSVNQALRAARQGARRQSLRLLRFRPRSVQSREIDRAARLTWARLVLSLLPAQIWTAMRRVRSLAK